LLVFLGDLVRNLVRILSRTSWHVRSVEHSLFGVSCCHGSGAR
jgi:hypothetical protein